MDVETNACDLTNKARGSYYTVIECFSSSSTLTSLFAQPGTTVIFQEDWKRAISVFAVIALAEKFASREKLQKLSWKR